MWGETRELSVDIAVGKRKNERQEFQASSLKNKNKIKRCDSL